MKGFMGKALAITGLLLSLGASQGCWRYREIVDPCYPQRYSSMSRNAVHQAFAPQVQNGHVLDQTVWNYHFEPGTDRLTAGGLEKLAYLGRRRPQPDPVIYLQTAQDIVYDPENPSKMQMEREELNAKRQVAIQTFLGVQTSGKALAIQVIPHDPPETGLPATPVGVSIQQMYQRFQGGLQTGGLGGAGVSGGAGAPVQQ